MTELQKANIVAEESEPSLMEELIEDFQQINSELGLPPLKVVSPEEAAILEQESGMNPTDYLNSLTKHSETSSENLSDEEWTRQAMSD